MVTDVNSVQQSGAAAQGRAHPCLVHRIGMCSHRAELAQPRCLLDRPRCFSGAIVNSFDIEANLITDNMPDHIMSEGVINKYITAADLITVDGHVCNKIGTFQNAITAHAHDIPYFAFAWGRPDLMPCRIY